MDKNNKGITTFWILWILGFLVGLILVCTNVISNVTWFFSNIVYCFVCCWVAEKAERWF